MAKKRSAKTKSSKKPAKKRVRRAEQEGELMCSSGGSSGSASCTPIGKASSRPSAGSRRSNTRNGSAGSACGGVIPGARCRSAGSSWWPRRRPSACVCARRRILVRNRASALPAIPSKSSRIATCGARRSRSRSIASGSPRSIPRPCARSVSIATGEWQLVARSGASLAGDYAWAELTNPA